MLFSEKVRQAEQKFKDGGVYVCPVCDGECQRISQRQDEIDFCRDYAGT